MIKSYISFFFRHLLHDNVNVETPCVRLICLVDARNDHFFMTFDDDMWRDRFVAYLHRVLVSTKDDKAIKDYYKAKTL